MAPVTVQQSFDLALQHYRAGRLQEAETLCRQILAEQPAHVDALHFLAVIVHQARRDDAAAELMRRAIALRPDSADAYSNLGNILRDRGQLDEALAACRQAIALNPNLPDAQVIFASVLIERGQLDEALVASRQAIALRPGYAEAFGSLGNALKDKGQLDDAIAAWRRAIVLNPNLAEAHNNLGEALRIKGQPDEAIASLRQAIALNPDVPEAFSTLGNALQDKGLLDESIASYRRAIALRPDYADADSNLVFALLYHSGYDARTIADEHRRWGRQHGRPLRKFIRPYTNSRDADRPLRIGYVSADFRGHSVGHFLLPLFRHHDHGVYRIVCYSDVRSEDAMTQNLRACADEWHRIAGLTDERVAAKVRDDRIDVLVDLSGHTAGNRLRVFARKPAPVQVAYLGYPATTGLPEIDYRLTDSLADPPGRTESLHTEKLWPLPVCNWCFGEPADAPAVQSSRAEGPIRFGSFNRFAKTSPAIMDVWAAILTAVPSSRLVIKSRELGEPAVQGRIRELFVSRGVKGERLEICGGQPDFRSHLDIYNRMDIALDSFPYHGTTTTCEALWMGVPVVSLAGQTHVSRVGVSLLSAVGLPELIAQSAEEYVAIAVALAKDLPRLAELRRTLRQRMRASPLMDAPRFARDVEAAYRGMWRAWCKTPSVEQPAE